MSSRNKAISILKAGRDALISKIVEAVLDNPDSILDSAINEWGDEDVLELGERLFRLNRVIEVLPAEKNPGLDEVYHGEEPREDKVGFSTMTVDACIPVATWDSFVGSVESNDLEGASYTLAALAQIHIDVARQATHIFSANLQLDPAYRAKAMSMRAQLGAGKVGSLVLIQDLFGIRGPYAERVYDSLRVAV